MQRGGLLLLAEPLTEPAHESGGMLEMCRGGMRCRVTECTASVRSTCERVDAHSGTLLECLTHVSVQPKTPLARMLLLVFIAALATQTIGAASASASVRGAGVYGGAGGGMLFFLLFQIIPWSKANGQGYIYLEEICINVTKIVAQNTRIYIKVRSSSPPIWHDLPIYHPSSIQSIGRWGVSSDTGAVRDPGTDAYITIGTMRVESSWSASSQLTTWSPRGFYFLDDLKLKNEQQVENPAGDGNYYPLHCQGRRHPNHDPMPCKVYGLGYTGVGFTAVSAQSDVDYKTTCWKFAPVTSVASVDGLYSISQSSGSLELNNTLVESWWNKTEITSFEATSVCGPGTYRNLLRQSEDQSCHPCPDEVKCNPWMISNPWHHYTTTRGSGSSSGMVSSMCSFSLTNSDSCTTKGACCYAWNAQTVQEAGYLYLDEICLNVTKIQKGGVQMYVKLRSNVKIKQRDGPNSPTMHPHAKVKISRRSGDDTVVYCHSTHLPCENWLHFQHVPGTDAYVSLSGLDLRQTLSEPETCGVPGSAPRGFYFISEAYFANHDDFEIGAASAGIPLNGVGLTVVDQQSEVDERTTCWKMAAISSSTLASFYFSESGSWDNAPLQSWWSKTNVASFDATAACTSGTHYDLSTLGQGQSCQRCDSSVECNVFRSAEPWHQALLSCDRSRNYCDGVFGCPTLFDSKLVDACNSGCVTATTDDQEPRFECSWANLAIQEDCFSYFANLSMALGALAALFLICCCICVWRRETKRKAQVHAVGDEFGKILKRLEDGVDPMAAKGQALCAAAEKLDSKMVQLLLMQKADVNFMDERGLTALSHVENRVQWGWERGQIERMLKEAEAVNTIDGNDREVIINALQDALRPDGTRWQKVGPEIRTRGQALQNPALATALEKQTEFKWDEWKKFDIHDLQENSFIISGDSYFKPAKKIAIETGKMAGNLAKDLKSGKFEAAAHGIRVFLQVPEDWDEREECTIEGMEREVLRLADCPGCAVEHEKRLRELGKDENADMTARLAEALKQLKERRSGHRDGDVTVQELEEVDLKQLEDKVRSIRSEIAKDGGWYYGLQETFLSTVTLPYSKAEFDAFSKAKLDDFQREYKKAITNIAGTDTTKVDILSTTESPEHTACVALETRVRVSDTWSAREITQALGDGDERKMRLDKALKKQNLKESVAVSLSSSLTSVVWPEWPEDSVSDGKNTSMQPLCRRCRKYALDYCKISADLNYVLHEEASEKEFDNGIRDKDREGWKLGDFANEDQAKEANLKKEEVAAMRLYTSKSFPAINIPLRDEGLGLRWKNVGPAKPAAGEEIMGNDNLAEALSDCTDQKDFTEEEWDSFNIDDVDRTSFIKSKDGSYFQPVGRKTRHPLSAITLNIHSGIKKLRAVKASEGTATEKQVFWRGFRDTMIASDFQSGGGTELAPMSTSRNVEVAVGYASRGAQTGGLLMKLNTDNQLQRGADVKWLSVFPGEDEVLYPPLTFMQPTGKQLVIMEQGFKLTIFEVSVTIP